MDERDAILDGLAPLKAEARKRGHFLYCTYQGLWFTPDELDAQNANGKFVWSAINWSVRDPAEHTSALERQITALQDSLMRWKDRVGAYQASRPDNPVAAGDQS